LMLAPGAMTHTGDVNVAHRIGAGP